MKRRTFVKLGSTVAAALAVHDTINAIALNDHRIKAIVFDAFPIFDPRPVFTLVNQLFPEHGNELSREWKTRQFEYTWLRTITGTYKDFYSITEDALVFAAEALKQKLEQDQKEKLLNAYLQLSIWPEVLPVLKKLKEHGFRLGFLSNFTSSMLETNAKNAGIQDYFEHLISIEPAKKYKPAPEAYSLAMNTFNLKKEEILFVAFAGWDAAGAKIFGYKTFWANRLNQPGEQLGINPDWIGEDLNDLMIFLGL